MASLPKIIDIEDAPDFLRVVEHVRETHDDVVIRQGGEDVAVISPTGTRAGQRPEREFTDADMEAFRSSAGSWKGLIDPDEFLEHVYERRKHWTRPPVKL